MGKMKETTDERPVYVFGHKNPDTDAICAAIAYANMKEYVTGKPHVACRCGRVNEETAYVLKRFGLKAPLLVEDVRTTVGDMDFRRLPGVSDEISVKEAWKIMHDNNVVTVCITAGNRLKGIISTGDLLETCMGVSAPTVLSDAKTRYQNILYALDGSMVLGDPNEIISSGAVHVAASTADILKDAVKKGDIVILGNRKSVQTTAIENGASCLIVSLDAEFSDEMLDMAKTHNCTIIRTPYDTFTAARFVIQSLPLRYLMKKRGLVKFRTDDFLDDVLPIMAEHRYRYFPVEDEKGNYVGMLSRRNLIGARKKQVILVDHNERSQAVDGIDAAEVMEIIDHHRLGTLNTTMPVYFRNQPIGSTCSIVYLMYRENQVPLTREMAGILLSALISDTLLYRSPTCTELDRKIGHELSIIAGVNEEELAKKMFRAGSHIAQKSPDEIVHQDFKRFPIDKQTVGIGQVSSMDTAEIDEIRKKVAPELESIRKADGVDRLYLILTNILEESSVVISAGAGAESTLKACFTGCKKSGDGILLPGVVSRKKQFLPAITGGPREEG